MSEPINIPEGYRQVIRAAAIEECAKVIDQHANHAREVWDAYIAKCRESPDNIGSGSQSWHQYYEGMATAIRALKSTAPQVKNVIGTLAASQPDTPAAAAPSCGLTFDAFRRANMTRCLKWNPAGIESWSPSDWLTAVTGELGELASLLKMRNRERDGLPGNKFSPTDKQIADELADVLTYLDLLASVLGVDLGRAAIEKFNEVSKRVGFPDRIAPSATNAAPQATVAGTEDDSVAVSAPAAAAPSGKLMMTCPQCEWRAAVPNGWLRSATNALGSTARPAEQGQPAIGAPSETPREKP